MNEDPSWNSVNGYYGLAKDAYPAVSEAYAEKALSNWSITSNGICRFTSIVWSPKYGFVGVGESTNNNTPANFSIGTSEDGINWTGINPDETTVNKWRTISWSAELDLFVIVGDRDIDRAPGFTVPNRAMYSKNANDEWLYGNTGFNLTNCNNDISNNITCDSTSGLFIGLTISKINDVGLGGSSNVIITNIINNNTFTTNTFISLEDPDSILTVDSAWEGVVWSPELKMFVAVGRRGSVMTSNNGINWSIVFGGLNTTFNDVEWSPELGLFVAVGNNNNIMISKNGIDWEVLENPLSFLSLSYNLWKIVWSSSLGLFCIVIGFLATNFVLVSSDGINWKQNFMDITTTKYDIIWIKELNTFLTVPQSSINGNYLISSDTINWKTITNKGQTYGGLDGGIAWSPELGFAVLGTFFSTNNVRIFRSSLSGRPPTSYNVFDSSFNNIDQNGNWTIRAKEIYNPGNLLLDVKGNVGIDNQLSPVEKLVVNGNIVSLNPSVLGVEKVINGNFLDGSNNWTLGAGWKLDYDVDPSGAMKFDPSSNTLGVLQQNVGVLANEVYRVSFQIRTMTQGILTPSLGGVNLIQIRDPGTYTIFIRTVNTGNLIFTPSRLISNNPATTFDGVIDNISVRKVDGGNIIAYGQFTGGGANGIKVDVNGNIGIGTPTPTHTLDVNSNTIRVRNKRTIASATTTGVQGEMCYDDDYIYICTADNTWKRVQISSW